MDDLDRLVNSGNTSSKAIPCFMDFTLSTVDWIDFVVNFIAS